MRLSRVRTVAVHLIVCSLSPTANADDPPRSPVTLTAQQDRQLMLDHLKIPAETMRRGPSGMNPNAPDYQNTDETKANPWPNLPEMMITKGRRPVDTPELWWKVRRPEIVEYFDVEVYGRIPNEVPMVTWEADSDIAGGGGGIGGKAPAPTVPSVTKRLVGRVNNSAYPAITVNIRLSLTLPKDAPGPVPVMMDFGGGGGLQQYLANGWGYAFINPNSIQADNGAGLTRGIIGLVNKGQPWNPEDWGSLRAWAWGASRALDYLETDSAVDAKHVGISGLSRYGKAALVAMAYEPRFAIGLIGSSGAGGAKLFRRNFGEQVENLASSGEYHWMSGTFLKYGGPLAPCDLPVDAHELIALCAPRPMFISYGATTGPGAEGTWVDQRGSFMAAVAAGPAWKLLGTKDLGAAEMPPVGTALVGGELAWRMHSGGHTTSPNIETFVTWASPYLKTPRSKEPAVKVPSTAATPVARTDANSRTAHEQLLEKARKGRIDLYFVGDSITRRWGATDYPEFLANRKQNFHGWNAANFGWGSDTVQNVLWRLRNGELDGVNPTVIVVMAGTNNVGSAAPEDIATGLKAVLDVCREKAPNAVVILMGITPRNDSAGALAIIDQVNERIERFADGKKVRYLNINGRLADKDGKLLPVMSPDGLHLSLKGYQVWADALKPILTELLGPPAQKDLAPPPTGDPGATAQAQNNAVQPDYRNAALPTARRVDDLVARMTLEEKIAQMMCVWNAKKQFTDAQGRFDPARAPEWMRVGIGRIERPADGHGAHTQAEFTNAIQRWVKENTRLGIPVIFHEEALHGLMGAEATSFPQAIALASTWNPNLVERAFAVVAREVRARGAQQVLAPVVDVARDPRWGRFEETFGEDPYLVSQMGLAAVRGFQGRDKTIAPDRVIATLKHMTGHGQPESGTNVGPANLGERTLRDVFFPPFEVAIKQGRARSLMPSYNEIDGIPSHANRWMLRDVLRGEWGFDGTIVSDWQAISQLVGRHRVAKDADEAARQALAATVDVELPDVETYHTLVAQVNQGTIHETAINDAVRRLLRDKFELGLFENPTVDPDRADQISGAEANRPLALEAARQAITLLQNKDNLLPLSADKVRRIAVIGPHSAEVMLGGYAGEPRHSVSILEGIRKRLGPGATVKHAEGVRITEDSTFSSGPQPLIGGTRSRPRASADRVAPADPAANRRSIADAIALARDSDVVIVVVGDNEQTAREAYAENHLGDRADLGLPGQQEDLVRAVLDTGKPTVLVLINGRPPTITELAERVPAILEGWYLGQEGGVAMAEVLFGDVNPSGKLPVSFPRSVGQLPLFYSHKPTALRGYLFNSTKPLFPFGHGLSYTTFAYSDPTVAPARIAPDGRAMVSVEVTNTGTRAGDEVVQLYIRAEVSRATRPVMELKGFRRITLAPGERRTVTFELGPDELSYHGPDMKRVVEPGRFQVMVGGSSVAVKSAGLDVVAP